jgi:hypothetical protein
MKNTKSKQNSLQWHVKGLMLTGVLCLATVAGAGLLGLCSCAKTKAGLQREQRIYEGATNAIGILQPVAQAAPAPINSILGTIFAGLSGLLAVWATHIHRSVKELQKPQSNGVAGQAPTPTG